VIAEYRGWRGDGHVGTPNPEVVKAIRLLKKQGQPHPHLLDARDRAYCTKYDIPVDRYNENLRLTAKNSGKVNAYAYVDDRAVLYKGQSAASLVRSLNRFKAYWE
jgi:hypothetical protein